MADLYNVKSGSPLTALSSAIDSTQTTITVDDINALPSAPNYATIGKDNTMYEVIKYDGTSGNDLTGVTRGVEGTAQSFDAGTEVARYITASDINNIQLNINTNAGNIRTDEEIQDVVNTLLVGGANVSLSYDDGANTLTITATDTDTQLSNEEVEDIVGSLIVGGGDTTVSYDDSAGTLTITTNTLSTGDVTSSNWGDYEIQKDGTDGTGIINFKTT